MKEEIFITKHPEPLIIPTELTIILRQNTMKSKDARNHNTKDIIHNHATWTIAQADQLTAHNTNAKFTQIL